MRCRGGDWYAEVLYTIQPLLCGDTGLVGGTHEDQTSFHSSVERGESSCHSLTYVTEKVPEGGRQISLSLSWFVFLCLSISLFSLNGLYELREKKKIESSSSVKGYWNIKEFQKKNLLFLLYCANHNCN